jgi:hypothetical protein
MTDSPSPDPSLRSSSRGENIRIKGGQFVVPTIVSLEIGGIRLELEISAILSIFLSLGLGRALSAAAEFRVFILFLIVSVASLSGHLSLNESWSLIGTYHLY